MVSEQNPKINQGVPSLAPELAEKLNKLEEYLRELGSVAIGFSGGIDSSLIAWVAGRILGDNMLAVTIRSPVESPEETELAIQIARQGGFRHRLVDMDDLADPLFVNNPTDRCYHCKLRRFKALIAIAQEEGLGWIADGSNLDDANFYRPGQRAIAELGVCSPLREAGLDKAAIRQIARSLGIPNWDKPAAPCLATRFPYNTHLTQAGIQRVGKAETYLHSLGFRQVRVRVQEASTPGQESARIEVDIDQFPKLIDQRQSIVAAFLELGYTSVTLDLQGYRSGSMDTAILNHSSDRSEPKT